MFGTPGSGKSFAAKREITNSFLITRDDIIICDPESEYAPLVSAFHGQVIVLSQNSTDFVNPMDININYSEDENPLSLKADFILSLCELIVGGKNGLEPVEKTVIDRAVRNVYREFFEDAAAHGGKPNPEKMPMLEDLYNELLNQPEHEARRVATALEIYVHGSHEQDKQRVFDCFCKKILKNEARDAYGEEKRQREREVSFSELSENELAELSTTDEYFATEQVFDVLGYDVIVNNELIAEALRNLPERGRDIILLSYFLDLSDGEIGKRLDLLRNTVQYQRKSTLRQLRTIIERSTADEQPDNEQ